MKSVTRKSVTWRLKIIEGQVRGLQKMIDNGKYCIDILHQSAAVKEAISSVENLVLENHLFTHVVEQIKSGKEKVSIKEIVDIYKLSKKK